MYHSWRLRGEFVSQGRLIYNSEFSEWKYISEREMIEAEKKDSRSYVMEPIID